MRIFTRSLTFQWDSGNKNKNFLKHGVHNEECEAVFFDPKKKILKDILHSGREKRYLLIGATERQRPLFIVFTSRGSKIRIISARDLNKRERKFYEA